uniref:50S ribosomal protein L14 n=1 Tax=Thuricola similis TaxID=2784598 RepID=A0A7T8G5B7_9CILI|nr:50S ribosomal protein L14 [Thuricola similis]QQP22144.1 50S ribosomal protein L14 [Thuricola similis]
MFQKNSYSVPSDSSGFLLVRIFQTRRCSVRKHAKLHKFLKISIKNTIPELIFRRKKKFKAISIRTNHIIKRIWGHYYWFSDNALIVLKKRMNTVGKELYGPTSIDFKIKKFRVAFKYIY